MKMFFNGTSAARSYSAPWLLGMLLLGPLGLPLMSAAPAPVSATRPSNRWLFIVEASRAMQPRQEALAQIAGNAVLAGMNGQMRDGDTLGVWIYNNELHAGEFALQTWSSREAQTIATRVASFLGTRKFESRASFGKVLPAMGEVISNSEFITVVLISSGGETLRGTPYDKAINTVHQQWLSQQAKARQPFLTVLRALRGQISGFEVSLPPQALQLPPLPAELLVTNAPPEIKIAQILPPAPVVAPPVLPSLIVHGKKPAPEPEPATNAPPVRLETNPPPAKPIVEAPRPVEPKTFAPTNPVVAAATNLPAIVTNLVVTGLPAGSATNQTPAALPAGDAGKGNKLLLAGLLVVVAGMGVWVFLLCRSRSQGRASLITQSLERKKK